MKRNYGGPRRTAVSVVPLRLKPRTMVQYDELRKALEEWSRELDDARLTVRTCKLEIEEILMLLEEEP